MCATLLLLLVPAEVPRIPASVVWSFNLAALSHDEAQRLDGRRVRSVRARRITLKVGLAQKGAAR
jgi:hypothetical protein